MKKIISFLFIFSPFVFYSQTPYLTGNIKISILKGSFECDLSYSNLPSIKNYNILLNKSFEINYIKSNSDSIKFKKNNSKTSFEAYPYELKNKILPNSINIKYYAKFNVSKDTLKFNDFGDWKGNIAFNGENLRASEQSVWYPIIYDKINDRLFNKITYNVTIECDDCNSIYLRASLKTHFFI